MAEQPTPETWQQLEQLVDDEITASVLLLEALKAETEAIEGKVATELERAAGKKLAATKTIEQLEKRRSELFATLELEQDDTPIADKLGQPEVRQHVPSLADKWAQLVATAQQCHEQNNRNGYLIQVHSQYANELLKVLSGEYPSGDLYDPSGKKRNSGDQHTLAKA